MYLTRSSVAEIPQFVAYVRDDPDAAKYLHVYSDGPQWEKAFANETNIILTVNQEGLGSVGFIQITPSHRTQQAAIDFCITADHRGKGYGVEAICELHKWMREETRLRNVVAYVDPTNMPSVRTFDRVGYLNHGPVGWGILLYTYRL